MPTIGSITKTIRFSPADLEKIESLMKKEDTTFNNAVHLLMNQAGVPLKNKDYESIEEMAVLMRVTPEKILSDIRELIEEGDLYYSDGKLINPRYEELEDLCARKRLDIDNIIAKVIREIENGK